ncbi:putative HAT dimerization domain-containing protein [Helianthus annuus]|nr:putative HAT dimerization domain-containing protein [Helianthus annuus]
MEAAQVDAVTMDAIDWWSSCGSEPEAPKLAKVAKNVLSQPIISSSAEREII